jgi:cobalt-zinc-cadmium resistance protein CzcA
VPKLPDFSFGYFNQSLIGSPIDAMAPIWQQPKSLTVHVGIAIPLDPIRLKFVGSTEQEIAKTTYENSQINLKGQYEQAIQEFNKNKSSLDYYKKNQLPNADLILSKSQRL